MRTTLNILILIDSEGKVEMLANINRVVEDDKDKNKGVIHKVSEMVSSTT